MDAKRQKTTLWNFYKKLGPGLITGASDDDPSGIVTYTQAGAQFGPMTLWSAFLTFPLMISIQEMCARIGIVTGKTLTKNIKEHYSKLVLWFIILLIVPAIILNIAADIAGMGAVSHLMVPFIPTDVFCIFYTLILIVCIIFFSYDTLVKILKYCCLSLVLYIIIPFTTKTPWGSILKHTFIPHVQFNREFLSILVAILGTTISPYMFFWQGIMAVEETKNEPQNRTKSLLKNMRIDVCFGMFSSNIVMYFIILTAGTVLFQNQIHQIDTVDQAAKALEPVAGEFAYGLFSLGILGTGFLTIPVLSGTLSYILTVSFGFKRGLDKPFYRATAFYLIIILSLAIALVINFVGFNPIRALIWTAILYGLIAPIIILLIIHIANNKKIMKNHTNSLLSNIIGGCTFILMTVAAALSLSLS